ncbi:MAG: hypothetical protein Ct9H90mP5_02590 [Acidimicrobiaceae bacterium]|nr:MAG: hypothetical protein Ct9H90mP5_02590 [Acidimicrobiaceae bacterium]
MVKPVEIVESFLHALSTRDMGLIMSFFDEDSSWQNVPTLPQRALKRSIDVLSDH